MPQTRNSSESLIRQYHDDGTATSYSQLNVTGPDKGICRYSVNFDAFSEIDAIYEVHPQ